MADVQTGDLEGAMGHVFARGALLKQALTHASSTGGVGPDNERLEFLGDAVVGLAVNDHLYRCFTACEEGFLTQVKSHVVSATALARRARALRLAEFARLGRGMPSGDNLSDSVLANLFEGLVGALYLDAGFARAREFVLDQLLDEIESAVELGPERNHKAALQEAAAAKFGELPRYRIVSEHGPDHEKTFEVEVVMAGRSFGAARGRTKKEAEQRAAAQALEAIRARGD
ncbi:MAG: ribonuclease III [Planctomycetota bacterium]|jgi:ribonuclease-3